MRVIPRLAVLPGIALAAAVGCSHAQPTPDSSSAATTPPPAQDSARASRSPSADELRAQGQAELDKAMEELREVSVFFAFDSSMLTPEAQEKLTQVGLILAKHPDLKVRVEGNCDERGSEQYNLALGQRRADATKKYITHLGARVEQITAISFGAEKPKALGHDEEAWKQNRRSDVLAQAPR